MHYTVAYDITDDKRRNKVAKILKDFGSRIQFSNPPSSPLPLGRGCRGKPWVCGEHFI